MGSGSAPSVRVEWADGTAAVQAERVQGADRNRRSIPLVAGRSRTLYDCGVHSIVSVGGIAEDVVLRMRTLPSPGTCVTAAAIFRAGGGEGAEHAPALAR